MRIRNDAGFVLIAALMTIWILTAVGVLVFTVTTQDVRISSRMVGEKKAFFATEAGVHTLSQQFDPLNLTDSNKYNKIIPVDPTGDPGSKYRIGAPEVPIKGPTAIALPGYAVGGGQQWGSTRFVATVTGSNDRYASTIEVTAGVGYGPVEVSTTYR